LSEVHASSSADFDEVAVGDTPTVFLDSDINVVEVVVASEYIFLILLTLRCDDGSVGIRL
jgi:hypothetical protein